MALVSVLTRDHVTDRAVTLALAAHHEVLPTATWARLLWTLREKPVTCVVLDSAALPRDRPDLELRDLTARYPSLGSVLVVRERWDPGVLFRLGSAGLSELVLMPVDGLARDLAAGVRRALHPGTDAMVTRVVSPSLGRIEATAVRLAFEGVQRCWNADQVAARVELTRAHLSVRLRDRGLPSLGRLMTWARMLHAARWLGDPGRSGESVSRQLGYANGAVFRRALRSYLGLTPTQLMERGGFRVALERFVEACDLQVSPRALGPVT